MGTGLLGGSVFHRDTPRPPLPKFQVLTSAQLGSETQGLGAPVQAESGSVIQALDGAHQRRAVSEVSLLLMGRAALAPNGSGGAEREG